MRLRMQMRTLILVTSAVLIVLNAIPAFPCSSVGVSPQFLVTQADLILRVTAVSEFSSVIPNSSGDRNVRFSVEEVVKGQYGGATISLPGFLTDQDDWNRQMPPYISPRPTADASCFTHGYRKGGQFLLILKKWDGSLSTVKPAEPAPKPVMREAASKPPAAQGRADGSLAGSVFDGTGAVIPGVRVTVASRTIAGNSITETEIQTATSDQAGYYSFAALTPGQYSLKAELAGFATFRSVVDVQVSKTATPNIVLSVGPINISELIAGRPLDGYTTVWIAGPVNEQLRSPDDPWVQWVRQQVKR